MVMSLRSKWAADKARSWRPYSRNASMVLPSENANDAINIVRAVKAAKTTVRLNLHIRRSYACTQSISPLLTGLPPTEPSNPLPFTLCFYQTATAATSQKEFSGKANLSPVMEISKTLGDLSVRLDDILEHWDLKRFGATTSLNSSITEFTVKHIDPDEKMTFAYLNNDEIPVLCGWYEWKEWWKREGDRCQFKYDRIDDWEIETRFQGRSAALDGPPLFWEVRFFSPRKVSDGTRHFGTKESALAFHALVVERIISGEFEA
jgi:hypothetical protein